MSALNVRVDTTKALRIALEANRNQTRTTVFVIEVDKELRVPGYESWWDVPPIAEVSAAETVRRARRQYEENRTRDSFFEALGGPFEAFPS